MSDMHGAAVESHLLIPPPSGVRLLAPPIARKEPEPEPLLLPIWQRVILGKCANVTHYRRVLQESGRSFDCWTREMLSRETFGCAKTEQGLDLVRVSVEQLGFNPGARYREICERAQVLGLKLCPAEVGPALRLQYAGGEPFEWVGIGMKPVTGWNLLSFIFALVNAAEGLRLAGFYSHPDYFWDANHVFTFVTADA